MVRCHHGYLFRVVACYSGGGMFTVQALTLILDFPKVVALGGLASTYIGLHCVGYEYNSRTHLFQCKANKLLANLFQRIIYQLWHTSSRICTPLSSHFMESLVTSSRSVHFPQVMYCAAGGVVWQCSIDSMGTRYLQRFMGLVTWQYGTRLTQCEVWLGLYHNTTILDHWNQMVMGNQYWYCIHKVLDDERPLVKPD